MELQKIIYSALTNSSAVVAFSGARIYHKYLPKDFSINNITTTFSYDVNEEQGSFDKTDELQVYDLNIKLNYKTSASLYEYMKVVKSVILGMYLQYSEIQYIEYLDDNLIWNPKYEFFNLNLRFELHYQA